MALLEAQQQLPGQEEQHELRSGDGLFDFSLCKRNSFLGELGVKPAKFRSTGTTIAGAVFKDGVILGADTRATAGGAVVAKSQKKMVEIAPNIFCCGAGVAADNFNVKTMLRSQLELHRHATGRPSRVITAVTLLKRHLFQYQGHIVAAMIIGGVDSSGAHLYDIYPHGSTDSLPFMCMGSGSLAAMSVFESKYKANMTREEGITLVAQAIKGGIFNDLASGNGVDICVITKDGGEYLRGYEIPVNRTFRASELFTFPPGRTEIISEIKYLRSKGVVVDGDAMEE